MDLLTSTIELARQLGFNGVCVVHQGGGDTPYVAVIPNRNGHILYRSWDTHATPDEALQDLKQQLEAQLRILHQETS